KIRLVLLACVLTAPLLSGALWLGERHHCPVSVTFLAVGQGDAALIETPSMVILVDAGPRWETDAGWEDAGKRDILPYLQRRGIRRIDLAITSHPHLDHYGGYYSLVEKLKIGRFITVRGAGDSPAYLALLTALQKKGVAFEYVQNGSLLPLAQGLKLIFWQPLADPQASLNDQSLVVQLVHQDVRFLLSGDLEAAGEAALLAMPGFEPHHSILKVPHHGSSTSSTDDFLAQVAPAEAIVSVGERNKYHHPTPEVMERYAGLGIRTWRTDQNGAVCVCSRGKGYEIRTAADPS
ncbi:MAG: ComEC/Rec2 family competence protein, partial [Candidatus Sericytochromatia bacterium]